VTVSALPCWQGFFFASDEPPVGRSIGSVAVRLPSDK